MKTNQLRSLTAVGVLWLCVSAGCDPPDPCKNGECCWPNETNKFVRHLEGSRAGLLGSGFLFQEALGASGYGPIKSCLTCPIQSEQIKAMNLEDNLKDNVVYDKPGHFRLIDSTRAYPYQVWGTLYELPDIPKLTSVPVYVFHIERAEKVQ